MSCVQEGKADLPDDRFLTRLVQTCPIGSNLEVQRDEDGISRKRTSLPKAQEALEVYEAPLARP